VTFDLYAWASPRGLDGDAAAAAVAAWDSATPDGVPPPHDAGLPFDPSTDVGWFYRELVLDLPGIEAASDVPRSRGTTPLWRSMEEASPARVVAMRLPFAQEIRRRLRDRQAGDGS